ncbi:MAG: LysM peptidoglycan-binding domain-containing protein [Planctomycetota bacterium]|nr:MAG: LysM peptidoglycan-binding domain-containing protein [Planctomycetota bacterium]
MTRETKMGLLIGLGVIVVFAVLLSHHNPVPPAGDGLELVTEKPASEESRIALAQDSDTMDTGRESEYMVDGQVSFVEPSELEFDQPSTSETVLVENLPRPGVLDPAFDEVSDPSTGDNVVLTDLPATVESPVSVARADRIAPPLEKPVEEPQPTLHHESAEQTLISEMSDSRKAPATKKIFPSREYIVCKGDTLGHIAEKVYGTSRAGVLDFLAKSNRSRIKNKNFVVEGQKLQTPELPPELFERVKGLNIVNISKSTRAIRVDELLKEQQPVSDSRRTPESTDPVQVKGDPAKQIEKDANKPFRWYTIKPDDTFISISRKQLGSSKYWPEIRKLNKNINPRKMIPGTRIKLPRKPPISEVSISEQTSA